MSNEIMIPDVMPDYMVVSAGQAFQENADLMDGISLGMPPSLKLSGTRFMLRESDGSERIVDATKINVVVLAGRPGLKKTFYASAYDPNQGEAKAPDCFSDDGLVPSPQSTQKQCESCAGCPQNQFGTAKNDAGQFTKGKACRDFKIMAILAKHPNDPASKVYEFDLPPASLKSFGAYTKALSDRGIPVYNVATTLGFDPEHTYPVVSFAFGGWLDQAMIASIDNLRKSDEVQDIITPRVVAAPQIAAPVQPVVQEAPIAAPEVVAPVVAVPPPVAPPAQVVPAPVAPPAEVVPIGVAPVEVAPIGVAPPPVAPPVYAPPGYEAAPLTAPPVQEVAPAPVAPPVQATGITDVRGVVWSPDHHASNKSTKQDGSWKARKGGDKDALDAYEAQFLGGAAPAPQAAPVQIVTEIPITAVPVAPVAPVAPVQAAPVYAPPAQPVTVADSTLAADLGL